MTLVFGEQRQSNDVACLALHSLGKTLNLHLSQCY